LVHGGGLGIPGALHRACAADARLRQAVRGGLRRVRCGVRRDPSPGRGTLAFFSRPFVARRLKLAAYERELIGLVQVVHHLRPLSLGASLPCPHRPLQPEVLAGPETVDDPSASVAQQALRVRLRGRVPPGRLNTVADALSRRDMEADPAPHTTLAISGPTFAFIDGCCYTTPPTPGRRARRAMALRRRLAPAWLPHLHTCARRPSAPGTPPGALSQS